MVTQLHRRSSVWLNWAGSSPAVRSSSVWLKPAPARLYDRPPYGWSRLQPGCTIVLRMVEAGSSPAVRSSSVWSLKPAPARLYDRPPYGWSRLQPGCTIVLRMVELSRLQPGCTIVLRMVEAGSSPAVRSSSVWLKPAPARLYDGWSRLQPGCTIVLRMVEAGSCTVTSSSRGRSVGHGASSVTELGGVLSRSSGAVWKSRWPSWAFRPNEPCGFSGRKAILNGHAGSRIGLSLSLICQLTSEDITEATQQQQQLSWDVCSEPDRHWVAAACPATSQPHISGNRRWQRRCWDWPEDVHKSLLLFSPRFFSFFFLKKIK